MFFNHEVAQPPARTRKYLPEIDRRGFQELAAKRRAHAEKPPNTSAMRSGLSRQRSIPVMHPVLVSMRRSPSSGVGPSEIPSPSMSFACRSKEENMRSHGRLRMVSFLRHHRELYAELGKLLYGLLSRYFCQAADRKIRTAPMVGNCTTMVSSHQSFGEFASWNPHWHMIVLEGGFDRHDRFFFIPIGAGEALCEVWRRTDKEFARTLLSWRHSGFSIDARPACHAEAGQAFKV
jgi:hypothetical protein